MVGAEFGLIGGHVDIDRTIALASLAAEAKIERFLDGFAAPAILDRVATQHLEQQACAAAGAMLLLQGRHIAGAHPPVFAVGAAARADPDATQCRASEAA